MGILTRRELIGFSTTCAGIAALPRSTSAAPIPHLDAQPLCSDVRRVIKALDYLGSPLNTTDLTALNRLFEHPGYPSLAADIQHVLERYVLFNVNINPESRVSVTQSVAAPQLVQNGWRVFLVKVNNLSGVTAKLGCTSKQSLDDSGQAPGSQITATGVAPPGSSRPVPTISPADVMDRWLELEMFDKPPLTPELTGLLVEYRIIQLYSRDSGQREAELSFDVGSGSADTGFRNSAAILFHCRAACAIQLRIRDADGTPATASLIIRDQQGRVYPSRAKRLAPDFPFQKQIYRADGQSILLPSGTYTVDFERGPEYLLKTKTLSVKNASRGTGDFQLERWINPTESGWYAGDHHVHAAGCSHYNTPSDGVRPSDMAPQIRGEGLSFGDILTWGPCWYHQKQFFRGRIDPVSDSRSILRYDVEVSGFPSSYWGHLVLLQLADQDYSAAKQIEDWPTWNLPILKWAKAQGAVTGFAHTGHGLTVSSHDVPNVLIPAFNDNGANEFLIDVTHGAVDFLSAADTPAPAELNLWYHVLNCGFKIPIAGETDFPCLFDKVGIGRTYVHLQEKPTGDAGYRTWIAGLKAGRSYVSDGRSHILDLSIAPAEGGVHRYERQLSQASKMSISTRVAAYLPLEVSDEAESIRKRSLDEPPYWHVERSRTGSSRRVLVELVINGRPVATREIEADGRSHSVVFETTIHQSSWVAVRIFPTCHSNPIYVEVGRKPIRTSAKSAQWCIDCIEAAWQRLGGRIAPKDRSEAGSATKYAVAVFHRILSETRPAEALPPELG